LRGPDNPKANHSAKRVYGVVAYRNPLTLVRCHTGAGTARHTQKNLPHRAIDSNMVKFYNKG